MDIKENLRIVRKMLDIDGAYIATKLDITPTAYYKYESGETKLTFERLEQIAAVLGVSAEYIVNFDKKMVFNFHHQSGGNAGYIAMPNNMEELLQMLDKLNEPYRSQIAQMSSEISFLRNLVGQRN
jgi:transcriptional regulator with XRE-family HTH domain